MSILKKTIEKVAIVGAGTMGQGIAQVVALAGYQVLLNDVHHSMLDRALNRISLNLDKGIEKGKISTAQKELALSRIAITDDLTTVKADMIIEAVIEDLEIKQALFGKLEKINSRSAIFASNTSSIPIGRIASSLDNPARLGGLHFFNPAHIMKLVEVIKSETTSDETAEILIKFSESIGKKPAVAADSPGFIVNRVARHFYVESLKILEQNGASHQVIDDLLENYGFRMGPFKLMDLIGVDTNLAVTKSIYQSFDQHPRFEPSSIQQAKVDEGHIGKKAGRGFYNYA